MPAALIDGKAIAADLRAHVASEVARLKRDHGIIPGLAVVLVGNDAASEVYVRNKHVQTQAAGMASFAYPLPADVALSDLLALIAKLNADPAVHGILVQLPLPKGLDSAAVIAALDPAKDVDGLHPSNAGRLATGLPALSPCTPLGCIILAKSVRPSLDGCDAIVIGRSNLVGRPLVQLLLDENATVTIAHSRSRDLALLCRRADLVFAAVGRPQMVRGDWIKPGAAVIDVGINRVPGPDGKAKLVGDVDFAAAMKVAGHVTPVPGGVGPMTVACLMYNTLQAARRTAGLPFVAV